jgi:AcrR family transcriptional regulator
VPRRRSLTPIAIAEAALAVADREGLDRLSMRTVAAELGTGVMSLYRYVEGRDELEGLVVDLVLTAVPLPAQERPWPGRLADLVAGVRTAMAAHPTVVPLLLTRRHMAEASLRWGEAVIGALAEAGLEGTDRVVAFRTLIAYLFGAVQVEHLGPLSGPGTAALAELPPDRYPALTANARHARTVSADEEFHGGLAAVLRGLGLAPDLD